jgi:hopanoid biosynthesis associated protein HpnK
MVGSPAAADAVERAKRLPSLRVGLHVTVVRGLPLLPAGSIPDIVDSDGMLCRDLVAAGLRFAFRGHARLQLEAEIRAQFESFRRTGLTLDHVDAHNHLHFHPAVFEIILRVGRDYGMSAVRIPYEPLLRSWRASRDRLAGRIAWSAFLFPWLALLRARALRSGLVVNDSMFGMGDSGHMTVDRFLRIIDQLPDGLSEVYFHPAAGQWREGDALTEAYERQGELAALTSPLVAAALRRNGIDCTSFGEVAAGRLATARRGAA